MVFYICGLVSLRRKRSPIKANGLDSLFALFLLGTPLAFTLTSKKSPVGVLRTRQPAFLANFYGRCSIASRVVGYSADGGALPPKSTVPLGATLWPVCTTATTILAPPRTTPLGLRGVHFLNVNAPLRGLHCPWGQCSQSHN